MVVMARRHVETHDRNIFLRVWRRNMQFIKTFGDICVTIR
jgi:hypothetical protein